MGVDASPLIRGDGSLCFRVGQQVNGEIMKNSVKTGLQILGLAVWATAWIGGGLWLGYLGTRIEEKDD